MLHNFWPQKMKRPIAFTVMYYKVPLATTTLKNDRQ